MRINIKILFWLLFCLALVPVIFYPVSTDLGEFLLGGKTIFLGKKIYVDFIDIKPPFCYYIFAVFFFFSRNSEIGIRIIDVTWQVLTVLSIIYTMKKITGRDLPGYSASLVYCLTYTVLQYYNTFQLETMLALPLVLITGLLFSPRKSAAAVAIGLLTGLVTGLKYTFGIIIFPVLIYVLLDNDKVLKSGLKNALILSLSALAGLLLASLPLLQSDVRSEFVNIAVYVNQYNARTFQNIYLTALKTTYLQLTGKFSYLFLLMAVLPVITAFKKFRVNGSGNSGDRKLITISFLMLLFLWISILIEQKFFEYHFARLFLPLSLLTGLGTETVIGWIKKLRDKGRKYFVSGIIFSIILAISASPLPTWLKLTRVPYYYFTDKAKYDIYYEIPDNPVRYRTYYRQAAEYLRGKAVSNDKMFVMGIGSNIIYLLAGADNFSRYSMSSFYFYKDAPESWKKDIFREMSSSKWLIVAYRSNYPYFTRDNKTVLENIRSNPRLDSLLKCGFSLEFQNEQYQVYKRQ